MEPLELYETTSTGDEHEWGEGIAWEPPGRIAYLWHLRFDRSDATEVESAASSRRGEPAAAR